MNKTLHSLVFGKCSGNTGQAIVLKNLADFN